MSLKKGHDPLYPMKWYAFSFAYFFGLFANDFIVQALVCLFLLLYFISSSKISFYFLIFSCFSFGFFYGTKNTLPQMPLWYEENQKSLYTATVEKVQLLQDRRARLIVSNIQEKPFSKPLKGMGLVYLYYDEESRNNSDFPLKGMQIEFEGKVNPISFSYNKGIMPAEQYWFDKDIYYSSYLYMRAHKELPIKWSGNPTFLAKIRNILYENYIELLQDNEGNISQAKAFLPALIFGERFYLNTESLQLFTKTSLIHSTALSGMHLAFALLCAFVLAKTLTFINPALLYKVPFKILLNMIALPLALMYLWVGNIPLSLLRASLMFCIGSFAIVFYKRFSLLDILIIAATCLLIFYPRAFLDISFQLSVLSVLAIALCTPLYYRLRTFLLMKFQKSKSENILSYSFKIFLYALSMLWISLAIQFLLYPVQAYTFGLISPYSFFNVLWLPLLHFIILPFAFLALFFMKIPLFSEFCISLSAFVIEYFIDFLYFFENNFSLQMLQCYRFDLWQGMGYFLLILTLLYWKSFDNSYIYKKSTFFALSLLFLCIPFLHEEYKDYISKKNETLTIKLLDVGQGQSILLEWAGHKALIDAGGVFSNRFDTGRDIVAKVLTYKDFSSLNSIIVSHFDIDHAKGLLHIVKHFNVDSLIYSQLSKDEEIRHAILKEAKQNKIKEIQVKTHDKIALKNSNYFLEILSPPQKGNFSSNNASMVLRLSYMNNGIIEHSAIFCGDIEKAGLDKLLHENNDIHAKVLVVPHHGALDAYHEDFYKKVDPDYALVSSGKNNRFSHPSKKLVDYFTRRNIPLYNTANREEIKFVFSKGEIIIH